MRSKETQKDLKPWAIVTGSSTLTGAKAACEVAADGLNVVLVGPPAGELERLANDIRQSHHVQTRVVPLDLTASRFAMALREATADLDVRMHINYAATTELGDMMESSQEWGWLA